LTVQLGIPNACNRCHAEKTPEWAAEKTNQWYGVKMERPARRRALAVARARKLDPTVVPELLDLARNEEIPAWRASLLGLLAPWADDDQVNALASEALKHPHPLVRAAAVNVLGESGRDIRELIPLLSDPVQLVRLDATAALLGSTAIPSQNEVEYRRYLDVICDQPAGALRKSELAFLAGDTTEAERWARKAATWDPTPTTFMHLGTILQAAGKSVEAEKTFRQATEQGSPNSDAFLTLGLFFAEQHKPNEAKLALIRAVEIDPKLGHAWYNLGLLQARAGESKNALQSLTRAEEVQPGSPEPAYARATILAQLGQTAEAKAALACALKFAPNFRPAQELLVVLSR
jgi:tetratricopeptide (TPR) repeat protein